MDDFDYETQAQEFRAAAELLGRFATPEGVRELVDVLTSENYERFHELVGDGRLPKTDPGEDCYNRCALVGAVLGRPKVVWTCRLRKDLSRAERVQYLLIWLRHFSLLAQVRPVLMDEPRFAVATDDVIPAGPFLDDLKAAGLVVCVPIIVRPHFPCGVLCGLERADNDGA